jgi:hypothetical protein
MLNLKKYLKKSIKQWVKNKEIMRDENINFDYIKEYSITDLNTIHTIATNTLNDCIYPNNKDWDYWKVIQIKSQEKLQEKIKEFYDENTML